MIEQSKTPKSLAYARLGKPASGKTSLQEEHRKPNRNSTGNIYEDLLEQIPPQANSYIRQLVTKNQREVEQHPPQEYFHSRKKSYAEIVIDTGSKQKNRGEKMREERETLSKSKHPADNFIIQASTPKNSTLPMHTRPVLRNGSNNASNNFMLNSFKKDILKEGSFLDNLSNYLEELTQAPETHAKIVCSNNEKLSQTLKIGSNDAELIKLASKLEQCHLKNKQLKVKHIIQGKELEKAARRQHKMKQSLFQMLGELKQLNAQLTYERKQRKKLQKIIDNFDIRRAKPERKTIGKLHNLNLDQFQNDNTENQYQKDYEDSFRDFIKKSVQKKSNTSKLYMDRRMMGGLDSQKVDKLFRSKYNSDDSEG